jgi:GNAT superfamily N-acetyltransferase
MLEFKVEPLTRELIDEMFPLQEQYWQDVAAPFHQFPPDVDWETYLKAQALNRLIVITARNETGRLVGGVAVVLGPHPHYACLSASLPLLFLDPKYRGGLDGARLVWRAEKEAEQAGAQLMITHGGMHNGVYRLFEGMKYQDFGRYFVKVLPNGPHGTEPVFKEKK